MLSGMGPMNWLSFRYLHPNIYTWVGLGVNFNVHHMKYALHSALFFFSPPHIIFLGIIAQNNPFKAHSDSTKDKVTRFKILNVKIPMLSEIQPSNPLTRRSLPLRLSSLSIRCLPSLLQKSDNKAIYESPAKGVQICLVRETLRFLPHKGCSQD